MGPKPLWQRVVLKPTPADSARVAALLSGDVDMIDVVPPSVRDDLESRPDIRVVQAVSNRVVYIHLDSFRDRSPFVTDLQGALLDRNPLRDPRVRAAISKAIDRRALVDHIMAGLAEPAGQLLPPGFFGTSPNLPAEALDREGAKKLLAEAGYPDGFGVTLHASTTRPLNSEKTAVAIAEMLGHVGIAVKVVSAPEAVFKTNAAKFEYSFFMLGWGSETGEASSSLRGILATRDLAKGLGTVSSRNRSGGHTRRWRNTSSARLVAFSTMPRGSGGVAKINTSGSTAMPLTVWRSARQSLFLDAIVVRKLIWAGCDFRLKFGDLHHRAIGGRDIDRGFFPRSQDAISGGRLRRRRGVATRL